MILTAVPLDINTALKARIWRNQSPQSCRTDHLISEEEQVEWFNALPHSRHRYFSILSGDNPIGMGGLTYINSPVSAEISLVLNTEVRGKGFGRKAVHILLDIAFTGMNLAGVYGECYTCSEALGFWHKVLEPYHPYWTRLPNRKLWEDKLWDSEFFHVSRPS